MSSETEFKCDFCRDVIVKAAKAGARGYCKNSAGVWSMNPYEALHGRHICGECIDTLLESVAFNKAGM